MPATAPPKPEEVLPQPMLRFLKETQDAEKAEIPKELRDEEVPDCDTMLFVGSSIRKDTRLHPVFSKVARALTEYDAYLHLENQLYVAVGKQEEGDQGFQRPNNPLYLYLIQRKSREEGINILICALDMMADMVPFQLQERDTEPVDSPLARLILYIGTTLATALKDLIVLPNQRNVTKLNFISRMKALESLYKKRELPAAHGAIAVSPIVDNEVLRLSGGIGILQ